MSIKDLSKFIWQVYLIILIIVKTTTNNIKTSKL